MAKVPKSRDLCMSHTHAHLGKTNPNLLPLCSSCTGQGWAVGWHSQGTVCYWGKERVQSQGRWTRQCQTRTPKPQETL